MDDQIDTTVEPVVVADAAITVEPVVVAAPLSAEDLARNSTLDEAAALCRQGMNYYAEGGILAQLIEGLKR